MSEGVPPVRRFPPLAGRSPREGGEIRAAVFSAQCLYYCSSLGSLQGTVCIYFALRSHTYSSHHTRNPETLQSGAILSHYSLLYTRTIYGDRKSVV